MAITINVNLDEILAALKDDLDFTGNADKYIKVNATADGFEFAAVSVGSTWGSITGTLSDQTDLQSALDLKANLAGASFTGDVSVTTSGSGDTLQLTNSGSGTTLNIVNSGSGDFLTIDSTKLVIDNGGDVSIGTATASARFHVETGATDKVGAIISAAAGQTANLLEVKNSGGSNLSILNKDGLQTWYYQAGGSDYISLKYAIFTNPATCIDFKNGGLFGGASGHAFMYAAQVNRGIEIGHQSGSGSPQAPILIGGSRRSGAPTGTYFISLARRTKINDDAYAAADFATSPNDSSILELESTTKGFLPPRMTGAQVEAIATPAEGLIAYATNAGAGDVTAKGLYIYNGTNWVSL